MSTVNLTDLFNTRIFRIPDSNYQRGYVWENKQLNELWNDIDKITTIEDKVKKHYMGVIYLEEINPIAADKWLCGVKFYNVIDGQQRLTTIIILLFELLKVIEIGFNDKEKEKIIQTFIHKSDSLGESKVYKFNYLFSNKNYNFFLNFIYEEKKEVLNHVHLNHNTKNLLSAKKFFQNKIAMFDTFQKNLLFNKITVALQFDIRTIEKDLDGQDLFELIHNRGKLW
jgi:uncharacterized protein with ParB-like and HNH nuclease domain